MSDLKKLIEGLPIKVISRDEVEIAGLKYHRDTVESCTRGRATTESPLRNVLCDLAWSVILAAMEAFEEPRKRVGRERRTTKAERLRRDKEQGSVNKSTGRSVLG